MNSPKGSSGFIERLRAPLVSTEAQRVERVLGTARAFLAAASLVAIWLDPTEPSRYARQAYGLLVVYVLHSLIILIMVRIREESTPRFRFGVHLVDLLWPAAIALFTTGPNSPFFVFNVFVLLAAAYRWGFVETLATAAAEVVLFFSQAVFMTWGPAPIRVLIEGELELNRFIMRGIYLLIMGYLLGYLGDEEKQLRAETLGIARIAAKAQAGFGLRATLQAVLDEILQLYGASRALLAVRETNTSRAFLWEARREAGAGQVNVSSSELDPSEKAAYLFDSPGEAWSLGWSANRDAAEQADVSVLDERGVWRRETAWTPPESLLRSREFHLLLAVNASYGNEWVGQVFVLDPALGSSREEAARYLLKLVRQVSPAIYSAYLTRRLRSRVGAVERARVARELHDGVIQSLIGLEMQVDVLRRQAAHSVATLGEELARIQQLLHREVLNLRELMQQMRPVDLGPKQLVDFLATTVEKFQRDTGITARFISAFEEVPLPARVCNEVARIIQELLVNVRKHSGARNVLLRLDAQDGYWRLVIDDDGRGFEFSGRLTQSELDATRKGPVIIRERVRSIKGELAIESTPGRGARLEITFPQKFHD